MGRGCRIPAKGWALRFCCMGRVLGRDNPSGAGDLEHARIAGLSRMWEGCSGDTKHEGRWDGQVGWDGYGKELKRTSGAFWHSDIKASWYFGGPSTDGIAGVASRSKYGDERIQRRAARYASGEASGMASEGRNWHEMVSHLRKPQEAQTASSNLQHSPIVRGHDEEVRGHRLAMWCRSLPDSVYPEGHAICSHAMGRAVAGIGHVHATMPNQSVPTPKQPLCWSTEVQRMAYGT